MFSDAGARRGRSREETRRIVLLRPVASAVVRISVRMYDTIFSPTASAWPPLTWMGVAAPIEPPDEKTSESAA